MLSTLYAAVVRRRRERFAARPELRRRLRHPVISIGNLAVGGRGKTPMTATVARLLLEMGERPAILSRGYGRRHPPEGVVIVRDPGAIRADLDRAGDEPFMLARQVPGASVLVCPDRYLAGRLAEHHLGATVHVLDDGFQHLQLDRDIDIVLLGPDDISRPVTLPGGRLREPLDTLIAADAIVTLDDDVWVEGTGPDIPVFRGRRVLGRPDGVNPGSPVFAVAGIAAPEQFFAGLRAAGWDIRGTRIFADHHRYSREDLLKLTTEATASGADAILTTEKDYVRLLPLRPIVMKVGWVPLTMEPDPLPEFRQWLAGALDDARDGLGMFGSMGMRANS
jgi:tetraacyldisaccharide 4'-kinase